MLSCSLDFGCGSDFRAVVGANDLHGTSYALPLYPAIYRKQISRIGIYASITEEPRLRLFGHPFGFAVLYRSLFTRWFAFKPLRGSIAYDLPFCYFLTANAVLVNWGRRYWRPYGLEVRS